MNEEEIKELTEVFNDYTGAIDFNEFCIKYPKLVKFDRYRESMDAVENLLLVYELLKYLKPNNKVALKESRKFVNKYQEIKPSRQLSDAYLELTHFDHTLEA